MLKGGELEVIRISVIIPTLNEETTIGCTMLALERQKFRDFETIVVDGGSTDRTCEILRRYNARIIPIDRAGIARAQNIGHTYASGEILVFTQADTKPPTDWLTKIANEFSKDKALIAITGPLEVPSDAPTWMQIEYRLWNIIRWICNLFPPPLGMFFTSGPNIAVRRWAFEKIGGFDEYLPVHEDGTLGKMLAALGKTKFCGPFYMPLSVIVSPRRGKLGFKGMNRHYAYILGDLFPFNILLPHSIWERIRIHTWIDLLRDRNLSEVEITKRIATMQRRNKEYSPA